jgi:hypothetical protein
MTRTGRFNRSKLNNLIHGSIDTVCTWIDSKSHAVQVDKVSQETGNVLPERAADFHRDRGA